MLSKQLQTIKRAIKSKLWFATVNFAFIIAYIYAFQALFGAENSIAGVSITIMMSASMARDLTGTPVKHFLFQSFILVMMAVCACLVTILNPFLALPIHFVMLFLILYGYTYEYASHLYFPYILSYLFLIFVSPVDAAGLPKRILAMLTGAVCIILYQIFMGSKRAGDTTRDVLSSMIDMALGDIGCLLGKEGACADPEEVRYTLCGLIRAINDRRKRILCISDASFAAIDVGRGLEHFILVLHSVETPPDPRHEALLQKAARQLEAFRAFIRRERADLPALQPEDFQKEGAEPLASELFAGLAYVQDHLLHMADPDKRTRFRETALSLETKLGTALDLSPVRLIYALRTASLLAFFTLAVQLLHLPHGKWLLFTLASLSLPYADDVGPKTKKRIVATVAGGLISVAAYSLIPSPAGRTAVMMIPGYLSFFLSDYAGTFACSTIGALGGAVFMTAFGWEAVGGMFLIRLCYICAGAAVAYFANCRLFPYSREDATRHLLQKYTTTVSLLSQICRNKAADPQLYYNLVIRAHLQEEKLRQNALTEGWEDMKTLLADCRKTVLEAHRHLFSSYISEAGTK